MSLIKLTTLTEPIDLQPKLFLHQVELSTSILPVHSRLPVQALVVGDLSGGHGSRSERFVGNRVAEGVGANKLVDMFGGTAGSNDRIDTSLGEELVGSVEWNHQFRRKYLTPITVLRLDKAVSSPVRATSAAREVVDAMIVEWSSSKVQEVIQ